MKTFLITGAARGIGKAFARKALENKNKVILWDVNSEELDKTSHEFKNEFNPQQVFERHVDLLEVDKLKALLNEEILMHEKISVLFNNAGVVSGKYFQDYSEKDILNVMTINSTVPMLLTKTLLPHMLKNSDGAIINMASAASYFGNPKMSVYCASKWALLGWAESLQVELKDTPIQITNIAPSYINTGMFDGVKAPKLVPMLQTNEITNIIWNAYQRKKSICKAPFMVKALPLLKATLPPSLFQKFVGDGLGVYSSMSDFKN